MVGTTIDLALVAIILIALVIGIMRGFIRQLTGLASGLFSLVFAVILTGLLLNALKNTNLFLSLCNTTSGWFKDTIYSTTVFSQEELAVLMNRSGGWAKISALSPTLFAEMTAQNFTTLGSLFGYYVANAIAHAVLWLLLFVLLKVVIKAVGSALQKVARLPILNTIDRILGAICSVSITYIILITFLLTGIEIIVYKYLNGSWDELCIFLKQSKVLTFANNTNYLGILLAKYANVALPTL